MHPYEIVATLRIRDKSGSITLIMGLLNTVIDWLQEEGLIEVKKPS